MYKYMAIRRADIKRMESKDLSRWAQRPKKAEAPARALPKRLDTPADKARMASELLEDPAVQRVMADAEAYDRALDLESDAIQVVGNRRADIGAIADAGVPSSEVENILDNLGTMQGGVPQPIMGSTPNVNGSDMRIHVKYETNPVTGERQVVPVLDPNLVGTEDAGRDVALVTKYGREGLDKEAGHQSEPAMMNAMKLLGYKTEYHDPLIPNARTGRSFTEGKADLQGIRGDEVKNVDVMYRDLGKSNIELPLYTMLYPEGTAPVFRGGPGEGTIADQTRGLINNQLAKQGNSDYIAAVEDLVANRVLAPESKKFRIGKLLRGDSSVVKGEDLYHELYVPGYSSQVSNLPRHQSPQNVPTAPDSIERVDLATALDALMSGKTGAEAKMNTNYSATGKGRERLQIKPKFEASPTFGVVDATIEDPMLQQLLSIREMKRRMT